MSGQDHGLEGFMHLVDLFDYVLVSSLMRVFDASPAFVRPKVFGRKSLFNFIWSAIVSRNLFLF